MISDEKCKKILKQEGFIYTDEEITLIKETLYNLVEIMEKDRAVTKIMKEESEKG
jgi:hypothetical protein